MKIQARAIACALAKSLWKDPSWLPGFHTRPGCRRAEVVQGIPLPDTTVSALFNQGIRTLAGPPAGFPSSASRDNAGGLVTSLKSTDQLAVAVKHRKTALPVKVKRANNRTPSCSRESGGAVGIAGARKSENSARRRTSQKGDGKGNLRRPGRPNIVQHAHKFHLACGYARDAVR